MSIIGLSGHIGSGKDTVANIIKKIDYEKKWQTKKFAYKLKQIASILTGIPANKFEDQEFKKTYLGKEWMIQTKIDHTIIKNGEPSKVEVISKMTVRDLLQKLGTEAMRNGLHPDVWVNALMSDYKKTKDKDEEYSYPNWIITDVRFPNEYDAIKSKGGIVVRVNRDVKTEEPKHISETALDDYQFDYVINNNGSMEDLIVKCSLFIKYYENK